MKLASETILNSHKEYQRYTFEGLKDEFLDLMKWAKTVDLSQNEYVVPFWVENNRKLAEYYCENLDFNFLHHEILAGTMSSTNEEWARKQLNYILAQKELQDFDLDVIEDSLVGNPFIFSEEHGASCNSIHHFYHFLQCFDYQNFDIEGNILEWGGGYGRLPSMFDKFCHYKNYTIIDIPVMSVLQYIYSTCVFGGGFTSFREVKDDGFSINCIPITDLENVDIPKTDAFFAMWSLGESADKSLDYVIDRGWLDSDHIMMATHANRDDTLPVGERLYNTVRTDLNTKKCDFVPNHWYIYR